MNPASTMRSIFLFVSEFVFEFELESESFGFESDSSSDWNLERIRLAISRS